MPLTKISGGVSNLSFSFRGNEPVREAMHSVFLTMPSRRVWTWGIVNAGQLVVYDEIEPQLRILCEDVILNHNDNNEATEKLIAFAETVKASGKEEKKSDAWRNTSVEERPQACACERHHRLHRCRYGRSPEISPPAGCDRRTLMAGMDVVGDLFSGRCSYPGGKSARVMKKPVAVLTPISNRKKKIENRRTWPREP